MHGSTTSTSDARPLLGFVVHGSGPEHVLVMHDWNGDHTSYDAVLPFLDGSAFTYVLVNLRGYGKSREISGRYTVEEIASDCLVLADYLGWQHFHVLGHSMTGMATQRIAADAETRVKSAIAVCPISAAGSPADAASLAFFASTTDNDEHFRRLINFVSPGYSAQWAAAKLRQKQDSVNPRCRAGYLAMLSNTNFVDDVRGLRTPFLVVVGTNDPGLNEEAMKATFLAWHPNAELAVMPNVGHYPMQECPPRFASVIERFLLDHSDSRSEPGRDTR